MKTKTDKITEKDLPSLIEDISDYLFERNFNIGTNFLDEFPNSRIEDNQIILVGKDNEIKAVITLSLP